jgi:hypothetical protein
LASNLSVTLVVGEIQNDSLPLLVYGHNSSCFLSLALNLGWCRYSLSSCFVFRSIAVASAEVAKFYQGFVVHPFANCFEVAGNGSKLTALSGFVVFGRRRAPSFGWQ